MRTRALASRMRLALALSVCVLALALVPTADAWPPVCIEKGADVGIVDAGVVVNCGVQAHADVCSPGADRIRLLEA